MADLIRVADEKLWEWKEILVEEFLQFFPALEREVVEKDISLLLLKVIDAVQRGEMEGFFNQLREYFVLWMLRGIYLDGLEEIFRRAFKRMEQMGGDELYHFMPKFVNSETFYKILQVYSSALKDVNDRQREQIAILGMISEAPQSDWRRVLRSIFRAILKVVQADVGVFFIEVEDFTFFQQNLQPQAPRSLKSVVSEISSGRAFAPRLIGVMNKVAETGMLNEILADWSREKMIQGGKQCPLCAQQSVMITRIYPTLECPFLQMFRVKSFLCFPFQKDGRKIGSIWLGRTRGVPFQSGDKEFLKLLTAEIYRGLQNYLLYAKLYQLATMDSLTGLANRRTVLDTIRREHLRAKRYGSTYALIMADLDYFKEVNDIYGHLAGDEVLRTFARILRKNTRKTDMVGRYGGEEFLIVLPETTAQMAAHTAERIRDILENTEIPVGDGMRVRVTASFGVCSYPQSAKRLESMLKKVDSFLYQAKSRGKNQVVFAE